MESDLRMKWGWALRRERKCWRSCFCFPVSVGGREGSDRHTHTHTHAGWMISLVRPLTSSLQWKTRLLIILTLHFSPPPSCLSGRSFLLLFYETQTSLCLSLHSSLSPLYLIFLVFCSLHRMPSSILYILSALFLTISEQIICYDHLVVEHLELKFKTKHVSPSGRHEVPDL